jgi:hypothetical protein
MEKRTRLVFAYPVRWFILGNLVVYGLLLAGPAFFAKLCQQKLNPNSGLLVTFFWQGLLLPLLYFGLYSFLRRLGANSQKFIYLVIALYCVMDLSAIRRAASTGMLEHWFEASLGATYVLVFGFVAARGARLNTIQERDRQRREREEAIAIQSEAIVRAHKRLRQEATRS